MSRIEESLYNSVSKYGISLNEDLIDDFYDTFDPDGDHESGLMAHDSAELDSWVDWLDDNDMDYDVEDSDDPDYVGVVYINEDIKHNPRRIMAEAVNPENEEANAIIKKYLGKKKKMPNKREQAILDKYGIKKDEYGGFVGPKGARIYADRTSVMGPSKPGRTTRYGSTKYRSDSQVNGYFEKSKTGGEYTHPEDVDALDKIDYANYLTKVDPYKPRGKNKEWSVDAENDYSMKPYSEPYKDAKEREKRERRWQSYDVDRMLDIEKEIEYRQRDLENRKKSATKHAEDAAKAEQDRKDIIAKARAKHGKDVDESMSLHEDRVLSDWEANLSEQDRFLYDGITNRLEDSIVAWMKFIRDVEGMTDSEVRDAAAEFLTTEAYNLDIF